MAADAPYKLVYWPGLPGRGEHIRLLLEEAGVPYEDTAQMTATTDDELVGTAAVLAQISPDNRGDAVNAPPLAPPVLEHDGLVISQTANVLQYLGQRLGLAGDLAADPNAVYRVSALALTALDGLSDEVHDCHHPVSTSLFYEEQQAESVRASRAFVRVRLPKFLAYFDKVLAGSAAGSGPWLHGGRLTYADLVLFQCLDGTAHQFPRAIAAARASGLYARVFALADAVRARPRIAAYLASGRRQPYGEGIYRHYAELDVTAEDG
ncbi:glutathione s-transferase-like protein [Grosmannia clavigera kw1407]|uniref:Glutathione s-transferase-like protein n=1 Tax=Grosmannia clavigera (strain kw1407 / UAMH 11150) TaxID=655863 RepID=F0XJS8_GROCL|nr:glutathione s-transferase-like protein [Grosmannia clavigera kw1407]EFX02315.1 glutathione s-transferase-like protein [Grosmannia clavigera kw1407]